MNQRHPHFGGEVGGGGSRPPVDVRRFDGRVDRLARARPHLQVVDARRDQLERQAVVARVDVERQEVATLDVLGVHLRQPGTRPTPDPLRVRDAAPEPEVDRARAIVRDQPVVPLADRRRRNARIVPAARVLLRIVGAVGLHPRRDRAVVEVLTPHRRLITERRRARGAQRLQLGVGRAHPQSGERLDPDRREAGGVVRVLHPHRQREVRRIRRRPPRPPAVIRRAPRPRHECVARKIARPGPRLERPAQPLRSAITRRRQGHRHHRDRRDRPRHGNATPTATDGRTTYGCSTSCSPAPRANTYRCPETSTSTASAATSAARAPIRTSTDAAARATASASVRGLLEHRALRHRRLRRHAHHVHAATHPHSKHGPRRHRALVREQRPQRSRLHRHTHADVIGVYRHPQLRRRPHPKPRRPRPTTRERGDRGSVRDRRLCGEQRRLVEHRHLPPRPDRRPLRRRRPDDHRRRRSRRRWRKQRLEPRARHADLAARQQPLARRLENVSQLLPGQLLPADRAFDLTHEQPIAPRIQEIQRRSPCHPPVNPNPCQRGILARTPARRRSRSAGAGSRRDRRHVDPRHLRRPHLDGQPPEQLARHLRERLTLARLAGRDFEHDGPGRIGRVFRGVHAHAATTQPDRQRAEPDRHPPEPTEALQAGRALALRRPIRETPPGTPSRPRAPRSSAPAVQARARDR